MSFASKSWSRRSRHRALTPSAVGSSTWTGVLAGTGRLLLYMRQLDMLLHHRLRVDDMTDASPGASSPLFEEAR
jgi:hypothetical protein